MAPFLQEVSFLPLNSLKEHISETLGFLCSFFWVRGVVDDFDQLDTSQPAAVAKTKHCVCYPTPCMVYLQIRWLFKAFMYISI